MSCKWIRHHFTYLSFVKVTAFFPIRFTWLCLIQILRVALHFAEDPDEDLPVASDMVAIQHSIFYAGPNADVSEMKANMRIIEKNDKFICSFCEREFSQKESCRSHMASHLGKTTCNICNKSFSRINELNRHLAVHEGKTVCKICCKVLSSGKSLKRHLIYVHGAQPQKKQAQAEKLQIKEEQEDSQWFLIPYI